MKICVSSSGPSLESQLDPRFGRCPYLIIVDTETMKYKSIPNPGVSAASGAGIRAAQILVDEGVDVLITGNVGPNAYQALAATGIKIVTGAYGRVRDVIDAYLSGKLKVSEGLVASGIGRGFGMGRGMGFGRGRGIRQAYAQPEQLSKEERVAALEEQLDVLQKKIEEIKRKIKELKEER